MRQWIVFLFWAMAFILLDSKAQAYARPDSAPKQDTYAQAVQTGVRDDFQKARTIAMRTGDPRLLKLVEWMRLTSSKCPASFDELIDFMAKNKHWPKMHIIRRNAELAILKSSDKKALEEWFKQYPPVSSAAVLKYTDILLEKKEWEKAIPMLHNLWANSDLADEEANQIQKKLSLILDERDYTWRLERLLWSRKIVQASKLLPFVSPETRKIAEARISLITNEKDARKKAKNIPDSFQFEEGLIFDQVRWLRRNKKYDDAAKLLLHKSVGLQEKSKWWSERSIIIRQFLTDDKIEEAYRLAQDHRMNKGEDYADAEWLAGWIALRSMKNLKEAVSHFSNMLDAVSSPVSIARGEYWLGRTYEELGSKENSDIWYGKAAEKITTIYGQLAAFKINDKKLPELPKEDKPVKEDIEKIRSSELFAITKILQNAGEYSLSNLFSIKLYDQFNTQEGITALAYVMINDLARPDLAVNLARRARQNGIYIVSSGYPVLKIKQDNGAEQAMVLSIIRQESNFATHVVSPAGARGLMQIMPSTAKDVVKRQKKSFNLNQLSSNPEYNVDIGSAYFSEMVRRFKGSYILAVAAYNAGPTTVNRWIQSFGTPGDGDVDPIDWIEMIPFNETRNYVLRVLENLHIYRRHLNYPETAVNMWTQD